MTCHDEIRGFFGQLMGFTYRLLKRTVTKSSSLGEDDSDAIHNFRRGGKTFVDDSNFMQKSRFRTAALGVVKASVDVEKERTKKKSSTKK